MITTAPGIADTPPPENVAKTGDPMLKRGPLLIVALIAAVGAAVIYLAALPAEFRVSVIFGIVFAVLGLAQFGTAAAVLARPTRRRLWYAAGATGPVLLLWVLARMTGLFAPDPWVPVSSVIGFTDYLVALLEIIAALLLAGHALLGPRPRRTLGWRLLIGLGTVPLAALVLLSVVVGVFATSDGLSGAGFPSTVPPRNLPAGARSTVEYCSPNGNPLAMDIYTPAAGLRRPAPVALYVHGGGLLFGDRKTSGVGGGLADHEGALFLPLQRELNARGFVVASIDYRLPPAARWPAQIEDAKCAVRFLRAHAADLGIDRSRVVAWGSSAGGLLVSLLGLTEPTAGFDVGQYADQSSAVSAVADMFSPADVTDLADAESVMRLFTSIAIGNSPETRRAASPVTYAHTGAPPFLILHGTDDTEIPIRQSEILAGRLRSANVPTTFVKVRGAGHSLATPGQTPSPQQLTTTVADFLTNAPGR
ncbi:MAG: alpha/beta hydrolase fold domain-containing protein [Labedaea sp.]